MLPQHNSHFPAIQKGEDVDAEDGTSTELPLTHHIATSHQEIKLSDEISSHSIGEPSTTTRHPSSANFAPTIRDSNQTQAVQTTYIIHGSEYDQTPYNAVSDRDVASGPPQVSVSNPESPSHNLHHYQNTLEDSEKRYTENLKRGRDAALSAECERISKQKIDTTKGSIRGLFGRGRHRDAWLIGCDTDATDFGGKKEGKIDAGRDRLSSSGTGRDKMVGTIIGREKLAREQDVKINSLLAARNCCIRRRMSAGGARMVSRSPTSGRSMAMAEGRR